MRRAVILLVLCLAACMPALNSFAKGSHKNTSASISNDAAHNIPDTVKTGVYINSIHNIDFLKNEYAISIWLWFRCKDSKLDFAHNLEIPLAKEVNITYSSTDTTGGDVYTLMKLDCIMKDNWKINDFPFDRQMLRFNIENTLYDSKEFVFAADTTGQHFDANYTLSEWDIDTIKITSSTITYNTNFGDKYVATPYMEYSSFNVQMVIERKAMELFWKLFLGMYISMLIAYMCFYINADNIDSRFGLSVGALFAVVGNKYVVDSSLPESNSFTLVDSLHGITLLFVLITIVCNAVSLKLVKENGEKASRRFDIIAAQILMLIYVVANILLILNATKQ